MRDRKSDTCRKCGAAGGAPAYNVSRYSPDGFKIVVECYVCGERTCYPPNGEPWSMPNHAIRGFFGKGSRHA